MTLSFQWLSDYLDTKLDPHQLADVLTSIGLEVEKTETVESVKGGMKGVVAGKVLTCVRHPDADRLSLTTVDVGNENPSSIVCGGPNVAAGQMVWVALPGTTLYDKEGKPRTIHSSKIRGALSEGMICAEDELGLGESHEGVLVLPDDVKVGTTASDYYLVTNDTIFEIGLTPNRSDATSVLGIAEDLAAYLTVQGNEEYKVKWPAIPQLPNATNPQPFNVTVRNAKACPRYSGILMTVDAVGSSPEWMQKRLQSIGVKSINTIVDVTNFVLHELGQPLHAFDAGQITGHEIIVETKKAGTPFLALDGEEYKLTEEDLMICDGEGKPMCIAGVYGGLNSGVTSATRTIFIESAHFNAGWVRRSSMRHQLRTEAARRFEKGSDPNLTIKALARAVDLLSSLAGGKVSSQVFDLYPSPVLPVHVTLDLHHVNSISGIQFSINQLQRILDALNMKVISKTQDQLVVSVPTNKADVIREIDVIEEILRIYGYINISLPGKINTSVAMESRTAPHRIRRLLGQFLSARGYLECMNMSLTQPSYYRDLKGPDEQVWITIHNTSNESVNLMRPEMIIPTLETVKRNINRRQEDLRLYEFGKSYLHVNNIPVEKEHLVLTRVGRQQPVHWQDVNSRNVDFFSIKSEVHGLLSRMGIEKWETTTCGDEGGFAYGLIYHSVAGQIVRFGKVADTWCQRFDIRQPVFIADFHVGLLMEASSHFTVVFEELNRFPPVERDLAIIIDDSTSYEDVKKVVIKTGGEWLTNLEVFDIYKNADQLGPGKMSMALRFTIENKEGTLTDRELDQWFSRMQKALISGVKADVRK